MVTDKEPKFEEGDSFRVTGYGEVKVLEPLLSITSGKIHYRCWTHGGKKVGLVSEESLEQSGKIEEEED
jgi:hypothetical protein